VCQTDLGIEVGVVSTPDELFVILQVEKEVKLRRKRITRRHVTIPKTILTLGFLIIKIIVSLKNKGMRELSPLPRVMLPLGRGNNFFNCVFGESNSFMIWVIYARGMRQND